MFGLRLRQARACGSSSILGFWGFAGVWSPWPGLYGLTHLQEMFCVLIWLILLTKTEQVWQNLPVTLSRSRQGCRGEQRAGLQVRPADTGANLVILIG